MSVGQQVTSNALDSPNCVSLNSVCPGASDKLKADVRQKSGTSNGPWSPSMPLIVDACRRRNSAMLMPPRDGLTRLPTRSSRDPNIQSSTYTFSFIYSSAIIEAYIQLCGDTTAWEIYHSDTFFVLLPSINIRVIIRVASPSIICSTNLRPFTKHTHQNQSSNQTDRCRYDMLDRCSAQLSMHPIVRQHLHQSYIK